MAEREEGGGRGGGGGGERGCDERGRGFLKKF